MKSLFSIFFLLLPSLTCFADDVSPGQAIQNQSLTNENQSNNQTNTNSDPTSSQLPLKQNTAPVTSGGITQYRLNLNKRGSTITVSPNQIIPAFISFTFHCAQCKPDSVNLIIIGIDGIGAQTCVYFGGIMGKGSGNFNLSAPSNPGTYKIRFRYAQGYICDHAIRHLWNVKGSPIQDARIGTIVVK